MSDDSRLGLIGRPVITAGGGGGAGAVKSQTELGRISLMSINRKIRLFRSWALVRSRS